MNSYFEFPDGLFHPKSTNAATTSMNSYVAVFESSSLPFATKSIEFKGFVYHIERTHNPAEMVSVSKQSLIV
jgi:uncharacterized membrane protein YcgQ (UPF0703/DUF1980 family)